MQLFRLSNLPPSSHLSSPPQRGRMIAFAGHKTHLLEQGSGEAGAPVLLLHGCGSLAEEVLRPFAGLHHRLIAPDRPGYGFSAAPAAPEAGPAGQSIWLEQLIAALSLGRIVLAAHSIAAGPALLLAARRPDLVAGLLLMAPFCRPTPHQAMPLLRAAVAPLIGPLLRRHLAEPLAPVLGRRALQACFHPEAVPRDLELPFRHMVAATALPSMAGELLAFNDDMERFDSLAPHIPVTVLQGQADATADPGWHWPWLAERAAQARLVLVPGLGHMPHHSRPALARHLMTGLVAGEGRRAPARQLARQAELVEEPA